MCGIAGYLNLTNSTQPIDENLLLAMQRALAHRGPDGGGIWKSDENQVGFAHRRLSIIDLSEMGNQPFYDDRYVLCYNGEIYNYLELKEVHLLFMILEEMLYHLLMNLM